ncbi:MAG: hypothetical protein V4572_03315 [Bacteroidota bacterium]
MNNEILLRRLSIIKLLFKSGLEQSKQSESISFFSILSFHDSIEMFLKLACEYKQIKSEKLSFIEYWDSLPHLTLKESMRNLNSRRVNLKHKGLVPAKIEVEASRINTIDFFEQNTKNTFGIEFNEISLLNLIKFEKTKKLLILSEEELHKTNFKESIKNTTIAFEELLDEYKENKIGTWDKNLFNFPNRIRLSSSFNSRYNKDNKDNRLEDVVKSMNDKFDHLERALEIISFGFDFKKYSKFKMLCSDFYKTSNGDYLFYGKEEENNFNYENSQFCLDFILECSLKLQEFDYENPNIIRY